jgi:hypothetical protein
MTRLRHTFTPAAMIIAALLLGGCAASVSESGSDSGGGWGGEPVPGMPAPDMPAEDGDFGGDGSADDDGPTSAPTPGDGRQVVTTGWMYLTVEAPLEAATEAARITERAGGRVDGRTEYAPRGSDAGGAELVLRIPSA